METDSARTEQSHLDLGCGATPRNPYGKQLLYGVDLSRPDSDLFCDFRAANLAIEPIPYPDNSFSSVSAFDFIEHVPRILSTFDGKGTRFPFIELMNDIWRVLAPNGLLYALTPAYPRPEAFQDPTHVNVISARTHEYFCGESPLGRMYGFNGAFDVVRAEWARLPEAFSAAISPMGWRETRRHVRNIRKYRLSHFLWELRARKPSA